MPELRWKTRGNRILIDVVILKAGDPNDLTCLPAVALLDTGATVSGVGPKIISGLGLESYGKNRLKSATDELFVSYYLFRLGLYGNEAEAAAITDAPRAPTSSTTLTASAGRDTPSLMSFWEWTFSGSAI